MSIEYKGQQVFNARRLLAGIAASSLLMGTSLVAGSQASAAQESPSLAQTSGVVTWQNYWNTGEYMANTGWFNGASVSAEPGDGGSDQQWDDVLLSDGYWVEESAFTAGSSLTQCMEDNDFSVDVGVDTWNCSYYSQPNLQWQEMQRSGGVWELINQAHDQIVTWKYNKYQLFLQNGISGSPCRPDLNPPINDSCLQIWR